MDIFTAIGLLFILYFGEELVGLGKKLPEWLVNYIRDWK